MENRLKKEYLILTSLCDFRGLLGIRNVFDIFMDLAAEHAARLGVGYYDMLDRGCYWVAVRTRVKLYERPRLGDTVIAVTWPGKPGLAKSDRYYRLERDGQTLVEGRTEWAVQDLETGAVRRTDSYGFPLELPFLEERTCEEPFTRFKNMDLAPERLAKVYRVESTDIDLGRHMNNVAYIRMLESVFSTAERSEMDVSQVEISYRQGCYEGEKLEIYRQAEDGGWFFQVQKEDGETSVHARVLCR